MSRIGGIAVGAALLGLLLALWASRAPLPEPQAPLSAAVPALEPPPAESAPLPPAPESAGAPTPDPRLRAAPPGEPRAPASVSPGEAADPALGPAGPEATTVPLDKLLTWEDPRPASRGVDLGRTAQPDAKAALADPGVRDRVYLERRTDEMSPGDKDRKLETTDVGVRVPVAGSVEVRGGVRIESRQDGESEADESTPTVGVGVRF